MSGVLQHIGRGDFAPQFRLRSVVDGFWISYTYFCLKMVKVIDGFAAVLYFLLWRVDKQMPQIRAELAQRSQGE